MNGLWDVISIAETALTTASDRLALTAQRIDGEGSAGEESASLGTDPSHDLTSDLVGLIGDRTIYQANAVLLMSADRMYGTLLDVLDTDTHLNG